MTDKQVAITDFLTEAEIKLAVAMHAELSKKGQAHYFANKFCEDVTKPNIARINAALGQENDPKYLAYMVEYVVSRAAK